MLRKTWLQISVSKAAVLEFRKTGNPDLTNLTFWGFSFSLLLDQAHGPHTIQRQTLKMSSTTKSKKANLKGKRRAEEMTSTSQQQDQDSEARATQLAQLEAFGNAFLSSFDLPSASSPSLQDGAEAAVSKKKLSSKKRKRLAQEQDQTNSTSDQPIPVKEQDEMDHLFHSTKSTPTLGESSSNQGKKKAPKSRAVQTVVFGGESRPDADELKDAKKGWKAFMSSKIDRIATDDAASSPTLTTAEEQEEKQLVANDRLLSELLSTTLFAPGSSSASNSSKPKLSSNDTIARILELSTPETQRGGTAIGRGWGETELKRQQLAKAPAAIRQGMRRAAGERRDKEREKAKELGTWHPSLKAGFENKATKTEMGMKKDTRKRERGMGVGIGKFQGGMLKLSAGEITKINGKGRSSGSSSRGKGKPKRKQ